MNKLIGILLLVGITGIFGEEHLKVFRGDKSYVYNVSDVDSLKFVDTTTTSHPRIFRMNDVNPTASVLLPEIFGDRKFYGGGCAYFKPGETQHPEYHVHDDDEIFIITQGKGILPIVGVDTFNIQTGDIVWIKAGEDHHTKSSVEDPLCTVYFFVRPE